MSLVFTTGCETDKAIKRAAELAAKESQVSSTARTIDAITEAAQPPKLPELPAYCRGKEYAGVTQDTPADVGVVKYDQALTREHKRTDACAALYDKLTRR